MIVAPVLLVLLYDLIVFAGDFRRVETFSGHSALIAVLFFFSGMPALVYQIVWERVLFSIYGVNAESVAVIVSAFMLGLGLGSLAGGWASRRFQKRAVLLFGLSELGVAAFASASLRMFHWAARFSAGASLPATIICGMLLLLIPTVLMGATLPLLVQHLVYRSGRVGFSVATLYSVNTFGSAVACYICATFLLRDLGQRGSVLTGACLSAIVGCAAVFYSKRQFSIGDPLPAASAINTTDQPKLSLGSAMLIAAISGFVALGFEIAWFRVFALASQDRASVFALLLSTYLAGVAAGSYMSEKLTARKNFDEVIRVIGGLLLVAGAGSIYLAPLVAAVKAAGLEFIAATPAFFVVAGLTGSILPLLCRVAVRPAEKAGTEVSWTYASNIFGSTSGSLLVGFVWMHHFGVKQVSEHLAFLAAVTGMFVLLRSGGQIGHGRHWATGLTIASFFAILAGARCYSRVLEKLMFGPSARSVSLAHVVENRNGVIVVRSDAAVYGEGVYDGYFNVDPNHDLNIIARAFAISLFHPAPKRMLMVGVSSGSWAQVMANHPQAESLDIVEINPGYLRLIPQYSCVASVLRNPHVHIYIDDGRRWLLAHPDAKYDLVVMNTSFYWRDHTSNLLSTDFLKIVQQHLNAGGVFYYNTTGSQDVFATGLAVFPFGLRVVNFLAVSDSPIDFSESRWLRILQQYRIDDRLIFDPKDAKAQETLSRYASLVAALDQSIDFFSLQTSNSLRAHLGQRLIITDDNMGWEWRTPEGML